MKSNFAAAMRRATRRMRVEKPRTATSSIQRVIRGAMVDTVAASLSNLSAMTPANTNAKPKRRKAAVKMPRKRASPVGSPGSRSRSAALKQRPARPTAKPDSDRLAGLANRANALFIPQGAQYLARTHRCAAGARDFTLYLPARQPSGPTGLIVMLHGCLQDPNDFATGTNMNRIAQKHGLAVAYPAQTRDHNASSCWNWFTPASQSRGAGEPAIIASLTRKLMREFGLGRNDVFVAGLSAGGAMAVILADTYPDVFSAAGVHSGLPRGAATGVMSALSAMRKGPKPAPSDEGRRKGAARADRIVRRIIFHGDADRTVHPSNAQQIVERIVGTRLPARVTAESSSGRDYTRSNYHLPDGLVDIEFWQVKGAGHAWSGGKSGGSYTDTKGPDAAAEMVRFFSGETF